MAKKSKELSNERPEWLEKIDAENIEAANRAFQAFCDFISAKLDFETTIDEINEKYGSKFTIEDIFSITQEQEQQALDFIEGVEEGEEG